MQAANPHPLPVPYVKIDGEGRIVEASRAAMEEFVPFLKLDDLVDIDSKEKVERLVRLPLL